MKKISLAKQNPYGGPTCSDVFGWFAEFRQGISVEDYRKLKNFTCDSDPTDFNVLSDFIVKESAIRQKPSQNYPLYAGRTILKLYELGTAIKKTATNGLKITPPFSRQYWNYVFRNLTNDLEKHQAPHEVRFETVKLLLIVSDLC